MALGFMWLRLASPVAWLSCLALQKCSQGPLWFSAPRRRKRLKPSLGETIRRIMLGLLVRRVRSSRPGLRRNLLERLLPLRASRRRLEKREDPR